MNTEIKEISEHLEQRFHIEKGGATTIYERFVSSMPLTLVKEVYEYQIQAGLIVKTDTDKLNVDKTTSDLPLAIMTFIACGESLGQKLELAFPEYKMVNPKYSFSNQS